MSKQYNGEDLENLGNDFILDFYKKSCGPCKLLSTLLPKIENALKCDVYKVDIKKYKELAENHNIDKLPTLIRFKNGEEYARTEALISVKMIEEKLI